jgi:hypothetical protein
MRTDNDLRQACVRATLDIRRMVWESKKRLHLTEETFPEYAARLELAEMVLQ